MTILRLPWASAVEPSNAIVGRLGFEQTGRHWDDEDGEELEFELRIATGAP